jgi:hypothetical protein
MDRAKRGAIALNNMGCRMMEQGCHLQAAETLRDAVILMKTVSTFCRSATAMDVDDAAAPSNEELIQISEMIHKAVQKGANPERTTKNPSDIHIQLVTDDMEAACVDRTLSSLPSRLSICFPICIETGSESHSLHEDDPSLMCSIILHNYGLTCVIRSQSLPSASAQQRLRKNAQRIFQLCQSVLSSRSEICREHVQLKRIFFLGIAVVSALALVHPVESSSSDSSDDHNKPTDERAQSYTVKLAQLKAGVAELVRSDILGSRCKSASAA